MIQRGILQLRDYDRRIVVPGTGVSLFSHPGKMPGWAWGIPAVQTCPGADFGTRETADSKICTFCYANPRSKKRTVTGKLQTRRAGTYGNANVQVAQRTRYQWTLDCLMTAEGRDYWVAYMTAAVLRVGRYRPHFRGHDSGDLFNAAYVRMWTRVCQNVYDANPKIAFWFPTRSWNVDKAGLPPLAHANLERTAAALRELATVPNLVVRPSGLDFDSPPPEVPGLHAGTSASATSYTCPSHETGGKCATCRRCWTDKYNPVVYRQI